MNKKQVKKVLSVIFKIVFLFTLGYAFRLWATHNGLHTSNWDMFCTYPKQYITIIVIEMACAAGIGICMN